MSGKLKFDEHKTQEAFETIGKDMNTQWKLQERVLGDLGANHDEALETPGLRNKPRGNALQEQEARRVAELVEADAVVEGRRRWRGRSTAP